MNQPLVLPQTEYRVFHAIPQVSIGILTLLLFVKRILNIACDSIDRHTILPIEWKFRFKMNHKRYAVDFGVRIGRLFWARMGSRN